MRRDQARRAVADRDPRFDGQFVHAVRSTGLYCRPSCPAHHPRPEDGLIFPTTAAAQAAGYRACRHCCPDAVAGSPEWNARGDVTARAMRLIRDGLVERRGVTGLATELGCSAEHLTRTLTAELGAGPLELARAQQAHTARLLLENTALTSSEVGFAAGFTGARDLDDATRAAYGVSPNRLRRPPESSATSTGELVVRLPFRAPLHIAALFTFLRDRAIEEVEHAGTEHYSRALRLPHGTGIATLRPEQHHVAATLRLTDLRDLRSALSRLRRLLDLDADPAGVREVLGADPVMAPLLRSHPGIRIPGSVDGAEILTRAVLGQQVSVASARTAAQRLARALGEPLPSPDGAVTRMFPAPAAVASGITEVLSGPKRRIETVRSVSEALADGSLRIDPGRDADELRQDLRRFPGIGPWTANYVVLRVLGAPDVLLDGDLALRRGAAAVGLPDQADALRAHSARWKPWRSYAGMLLWEANQR